MNKTRKPYGESNHGKKKKIERLIIRDFDISKEEVKNNKPWSRIIRDLPDSTLYIASGGALPVQTHQVSPELIREIKSYLDKNYFRAEFHFEGLHLEEITELPF